MMNDTKRIKSKINYLTNALITAILALLIAFGISASPASAANATVSFSVSSQEIRVGDPVSVTMTVEAEVVPGTVSAYISYDPSLLEYVTGPVGVAGGEGVLKLTDSEIGNSSLVRKYTFVFLASGMGTATVSLSRPPQISDESEGDLMSVMSGQVVFDILTSLKASSDATLSSLKCSPGTLEPDFSPLITEYSVMVEADTDEIVVSANANDPFGKVKVSGNSKLEPGQNRVVVTVTAEDGTEQHYVIYVLKPQPEGGDIKTNPDIEAELAQSKKEPESDPVSEGPIHAFYALESDGDVILVADSYYTVVSEGSSISIPDGYAGTSIRISGYTVDAYAPKGENNPAYLLLILRREDSGPALYTYDRTEKTIQRYGLIKGEETAVTAGEQNDPAELIELRASLTESRKKLGTLTIILIIMGVVFLLSVLVIVRLVIRLRTSGRRMKQR